MLFVHVFTAIRPGLSDPCNFIIVRLAKITNVFIIFAVSNPGTGADDAFVLKHCVYAIWPSHSRPAIAAGARQFQICFLP